MSAGMSRKPLAEKLGIKAGFVVVVIDPPTAYRRLLGRLPDRVPLNRRVSMMSGALLALVIAGGLIARSALPPAPDTYAAMIQARSG